MKQKENMAIYALLYILVGSIMLGIGFKLYNAAYNSGFHDGVQFVLNELTNLINNK